MFIFWTVFAIAVLIFALSFGMYLFVFRNPSNPDKRMKQEDYLHSPLFRPYTKQIKQLFSDFDDFDYRKVYIRSRDGLKLAARLFEFAPGAPVCIMMHGYRGEAVGDFCATVPMCRRMGFNVLLPDQRACGSSEGRFQSFGILERFDTLDWIKYVRKRFGNDLPILLIGVSMGAATVLMAAPEVPENVKGIFSDCSYTSIEDIILHVGTQRNLPGKLLYPFVRLGAKIFGHFDTEAESPVHAVTKSRVPVCFIHGYSDDFVPFTMCGELYDACTSEKTMIAVDRAGHACSVFENALKYEKVFVEFADKVLKQ